MQEKPSTEHGVPFTFEDLPQLYDVALAEMHTPVLHSSVDAEQSAGGPAVQVPLWQESD